LNIVLKVTVNDDDDDDDGTGTTTATIGSPCVSGVFLTDTVYKNKKIEDVTTTMMIV
jgi:hypothetical protein